MTLKKLTKEQKQAMAKRCVAKLKDLIEIKNKECNEDCTDRCKGWTEGFNDTMNSIADIDLPVASVDEVADAMHDTFRTTKDCTIDDFAKALTEKFVILKHK